MLSSVSKLMVFNFLSFLSQIIEKLKKYPNTLLALQLKSLLKNWKKKTLVSSLDVIFISADVKIVCFSQITFLWCAKIEYVYANET